MYEIISKIKQFSQIYKQERNISRIAVKTQNNF